jgi:diadenosine tetraphosphatase ApaH/serine/threonine PP2A family protein phosphatase
LLATRELDKAIEAHQLWEKTYPGDRYASMNLGDAYLKAGQYEQCAAASQRAIGVDANASVPYDNLAICLVNLDRLDASAKVVDDAFSRKLDDFFTRQARYVLAFLQGDEPEMQTQLVWGAGPPGEEEAIFLAYQALVHASPESPWRAPTPEATDAELESVYAPLGQPIAVYGHIHRPYIRRVPSPQVREWFVANTGSVGLSYDGDRRASYLLLDGLSPTIRRVEYDVEREMKALSSCGLPHADWIAKSLQTGSPQMP